MKIEYKTSALERKKSLIRYYLLTPKQREQRRIKQREYRRRYNAKHPEVIIAKKKRDWAKIKIDPDRYMHVYMYKDCARSGMRPQSFGLFYLQLLQPLPTIEASIIE